MPKLKARHWWMLAIAWFIVVTVEWSVYLIERSKTEAHLERMAVWKKTFDSLHYRPRNVVANISDAPRLKQHVKALAYPRHTPESRKKARGYISHQLIACGYNPTQYAFAGGVNLQVERLGRGAKPRVVIVGAHYDSVEGSPGADDNASGVAGVIELACLFSQSNHAATLRFAFFDAEEQGLLGSRAYVKHIRNREHVVGVFILEMIGSTCSAVDCQTWPSDVPQWLKKKDGLFIAAVGNIENLELIHALTQSAGRNHPYVHGIPIPQQGRDFPHSRRSDHSSFWDVGIGAVMLTDTANFRNKNYHLPGDVAETVDPQFMAGVVDITHGAIKLFADKQQRPTTPTVPPQYSPESK
jgi:hypothetical protein